jgi:hypothetical protein
VARYFSIHLIRWMIDVELGGKSAPFVIPLELKQRWGLHRTEPTFWERLLAWFERGFRRVLG